MLRSISLSLCLGLGLLAVAHAQETALEDRLNRIEGLLDSGSLLRMDRVQQQLREEFAGLRNDVDLLTRDLNDLKRQQRSLYEQTDQRLRLVEQWLEETAGAPPPAPGSDDLPALRPDSHAAVIVPGGDRLVTVPPEPPTIPETVEPQTLPVPPSVTVIPAPAPEAPPRGPDPAPATLATPTLPEPDMTATPPQRPAAPIIVAPDALAERATRTAPAITGVDPALPAGTPTPVTPDSAGDSLSSAEETERQVASEYNQAFELLQAGEFESAGFGFRRIINDFPDTPFASSARYWLAESHYVLREFDQSEVYFQAVLDDPATSRRAEALLKLGFIHDERGQSAEARQRLQQVIAEHPDSTNAVLAQDRLNEMRAAGR